MMYELRSGNSVHIDTLMAMITRNKNWIFVDTNCSEGEGTYLELHFISCSNFDRKPEYIFFSELSLSGNDESIVDKRSTNSSKKTTLCRRFTVKSSSKNMRCTLSRHNGFNFLPSNIRVQGYRKKKAKFSTIGIELLNFTACDSRILIQSISFFSERWEICVG